MSSAQKAEHWGKLQWAGPVIDVLNDASSEVVDESVRRMFGIDDLQGHYIRIQFPLPGPPSSLAQMDNASPANLKALHEYARQQLAVPSVDAALDRIVDLVLMQH